MAERARLTLSRASRNVRMWFLIARAPLFSLSLSLSEAAL
jgi:hypothetical protein